jgi:hypothetical protein
MDRDYLSSPRVVAASKGFVCARLLTYESAEEAKVLTSFFVGRSGQLENTTFVVVAPDGVTALTRGGRSPNQVLPGQSNHDDDAFADWLVKEAARYPAKPESSKESPLMPYHADARRGLDAAACDLLPLAVVIAKDAADRAEVEKTLRPLVWADARAGKLLYAPASSVDDLRGVKGVSPTARLVVVEPDAFGLKGTVLAQTDASSSEALEKTLADGLRKYKPQKKDAHLQIAEGRREGLNWKPEIPVTDPDELRAR